MNNSIKQIYVTLELCEKELKILVAEYFNTRFNILRVDRLATDAINDFKVTDKEQLVKDIKQLINNTSNKLGAAIEQVILVLPAYNFKRFPLKSSVVPNSGIVTKQDIARAISNSLRANVDFDVMVVNAMTVKYTINGISTRRIPEKEICDEMTVDIDLLCADRDMTYDYVSCIEQAGVKVLDITLNNYAICKEASLLEESLKQNIIILDIGRTCTYLSLISKGKLVSTEVVYDGINTIVSQIKLKYSIPDEDIIKLIKYDVDYNSEYLDDIVYAYSETGTTKSISTYDLNSACVVPITNLADKLVTMCKPILEQGAVMFVTGEGQQVSCLMEKLKQLSDSEVKSYYPETIGVRDPNLTSLYGALFAYRDKVLLNNLSVSCIDLLQYDSLIDQKHLYTEGETITTKIKNLFKQYIESKGE